VTDEVNCLSLSAYVVDAAVRIGLSRHWGSMLWRVVMLILSLMFWGACCLSSCALFKLVFCHEYKDFGED